MRKVTIYSTSGRDGAIVTTDVKTWGELKSVLSQNQIQHSGMKAVIGENRNTLEVENAELPANDFTLFLMPVKVKSGGAVSDMSYKELRAEISYQINQHGEDAAKHFNKDKNYTNKSTDEMRNLLKKWLDKLSKKTETKECKTCKEKPVAKEKLSTKEPEAKEVPKTEPVSEVDPEAIEMLKKVKAECEEIVSQINDFLSVNQQAGVKNLSYSAKEQLSKTAEQIKRELGI